ncbi:MAG: hypothetical protein ACPGN3_04255 [Opitutales bacterium]
MNIKFSSAVLISLLCCTLGFANASDNEIYNELTTGEKIRWEKAVAQKEKGASDIKSGEWYLNRTDSSSTQKDSVARAHAAGKELISKGEAAIAEGEKTLQGLRDAAISRRQPATSEETTPSVKYTSAFEAKPSSDAIQADLAARIIESSYSLGYSQIIFDAIYTIEERQAVTLDDWTQNIREHLIRLDGTRFSLKPAGKIGLKSNQLFYEGQPIQAKHALIYGIASTSPEGQKLPDLISIHIVDPISWKLKQIINVVETSNASIAKSPLQLEDTSNFFERLSALPEDYNFRLSYALTTLNSVDNGAWIPAAFKEIALEHNLAGIVDVDTLIYLYGDPSSEREIFTSRGNATFTFNADAEEASHVSLVGKSDNSDREILVGKMSAATSL